MKKKNQNNESKKEKKTKWRIIYQNKKSHDRKKIKIENKMNMEIEK